MVTPDLCVPSVLEVFAVSEPEPGPHIVITLVLDEQTHRYRVVHTVMRHDLGSPFDLGPDPFRGVDLASIVRRALVGIAPTGDSGLTIDSFMPEPGRKGTVR